LNQNYKILVTGVGAIIGYGIVNSLLKSGYNLSIIGMDIYDDAYGKNLCDTFIKAEFANSEKYIPFLNKVIEEHKIDLIIPGIEQDLYAINEKKLLINPNVKIVQNNQLCIDLSKNKWNTYQYFSDKVINLIPTLENATYEECEEKLGLPFLIKPKSGYASKGINKIENKRQFDFYSTELNFNCIYQRIIGTVESEYTVSVFGDAKGYYFDSIILKRKLSQEGATSKAVLVENSIQIQAYIDKICSILKPIGPTNIQLRTEGDRIFLLEINPRISSACSIRTAMGYNEPEMCIEYFLLNKNPTATQKRKAQVVRFINDSVVYE